MGINTGLSNALTSDSWLIQLNFPEHLQVDEAFPVLLDCIFFTLCWKHVCLLMLNIEDGGQRQAVVGPDFSKKPAMTTWNCCLGLWHFTGAPIAPQSSGNSGAPWQYWLWSSQYRIWILDFRLTQVCCTALPTPTLRCQKEITFIYGFICHNWVD